MREFTRPEALPTLAYAASVLFLAYFVVGSLLHESAAAAGVHLLFVPVLVLLVMRVDAPSWARLSGFGWAALATLADVLALITGALGGNMNPALVLTSLSALPAAAWVYGASMADRGAGHALGAAAAASLAFSGILGLVRRLVLVGSWSLGGILEQLALVLAIVWFAVLAKDLQAGRRHSSTGPRIVNR